MAAITILIGTMTGTAELVAEEIQPVLEDAGFDVAIVDMDGLDAGVFRRPGLFLICTSTYGQGDVPDNAIEFYEGLCDQRPDLGTVRFGIIGLGDSTYADTYNHGPKRFDTILTELGAMRLGTRMEHNASGDELPEEMALDWVRDWLARVQQELASAA